MSYANVQQSTTTNPIRFKLVDAANAPVSGVTPTITIRKTGASSFSTASGSGSSSSAEGVTEWTGNATDRNTLGPMLVTVTAAGAITVTYTINVVAYSDYDAVRGTGGTVLPGSGTLAVKPAVTLAAGDVSGNLPSDLQTVKTQTVTAAAGITFPTAIASPTNITAGTITTVTTLTGHTPQTGDAFARIGVNGAGLTALGDTRIANLDASVSSRSTFSGGAVASVTGSVGSVAGNVGGSVGSISGVSFPAGFNGLTVSAIKSGLSTYAGGDTAGTTTLLARLTENRAGYLDKLNVSGTLAHTDNAGSFKADVSGLLTAGAYVAPDNDGIAAIQGRTDQLSFTAGNVHANAKVLPSPAPSGYGGSGGGGPVGPGADQVSFTFTENDLHPVADADVWVTSDSDGNYVVDGPQQSSSDGTVTFLLDAGVTYYLWAQKDGWQGLRSRLFVAEAD